MKTAALLMLLLAQDPEVARILDRAKEARPSDEALAFYTLDWAPDLAAARERASKEGRPIFFVGDTNLTGPGFFFTGHC